MGENRNSELWNMAADFEIHNMFYTYYHCNRVSTSTTSTLLKAPFDVVHKFLIEPNLKENAKKTTSTEVVGLFDEEFIEDIAEEIYEKIQNAQAMETHTKEIPLSEFFGNGCNNSQSDDDDDAKANGGGNNNDDEDSTNGNGDSDNDSDDSSDDSDNGNGNGNANANGKRRRNGGNGGSGKGGKGRNKGNDDSNDGDDNNGNGEKTVKVTETDRKSVV